MFKTRTSFRVLYLGCLLFICACVLIMDVWTVVSGPSGRARASKSRRNTKNMFRYNMHGENRAAYEEILPDTAEYINISDVHRKALYRISLREELPQGQINITAHKLVGYKSTCWKTNTTLSRVRKFYKSNPYTYYLCYGGGRLDHCNSDFTHTRSWYERMCPVNGDPCERVRCIPHVYLAGVTKSGTTDLYDNLVTHPDIIEPSMKEPMYYNRHRLGQHMEGNRWVSFTHYLDLFDAAALKITGEENNKNMITIDGTPNLLWDHSDWFMVPGNHVADGPHITMAHTLHAIHPGAKILLILRNPVDRFYSHFNMKYDIETQDINVAAEQMIDYYIKCFDARSVRSCVYDHRGHENKMLNLVFRPSFYSVYLKDFISVFPREQVLVIRAEDYYKDRSQTLQEITIFLDIPPFPSSVLKTSSAGSARNKSPIQKSRPLSYNTRSQLETFFKPFNQELSQLLEDNKFLWKET